ncbi:MAG: DUF177 domain-containing protein [Candidatus Omnitrophica bacterium]|nr:DUF177 domain-containing protein [Candidatus Omnitrophota bacterium]
MRIDVNQIPVEEVRLAEKISPGELDLGTQQLEFSSPVEVLARVSCITNALTVNLELSAKARFHCSRCLEEAEIVFEKKFTLNYPLSRSDRFIDLNPDIREELIVNYPVKLLCKADCKGLCPKCGKNLNEGGCTCGST